MQLSSILSSMVFYNGNIPIKLGFHGGVLLYVLASFSVLILASETFA